MKQDNCWYLEVCNNNECSNCIRYTEMQFLLHNSGIPKDKQRPISLYAPKEDYNAYKQLSVIKDEIVDFVKQGGSLYIASKYTGNGKTSWSIKLLLKYFDSIWPGNGLRIRGMYVHIPTLLLKLKNFNNPLSEEYKYNLMGCDLVVWDDIASLDRLTDYDSSQLLSYIDYRVNENKANIYTGNIIDKGSMEKLLGPRLVSRIWNNSERIIFNSTDKRGLED